jgi:DGQHR domain-containing protein
MPKRTIELLDALSKRGLTNDTFRMIHHMPNASIASMRSYCEGVDAFREGSANELVRAKLEYMLVVVAQETSEQIVTVERFREIAKLANQAYSGGHKNGIHRPERHSIQEHPMAKITIPAARVHQGALVLYTTSMRVKDLTAPSFYSVETLDPEDPSDKGYQRLLNQSRAKKLADYIVKGQDTKDAFLPTSVFLATHKDIPFDPDAHTLEIDSASIGPFSVVDGQHRLEGLRMAAMKDERVFDFEVPVNIAVNLPKIHQMCHFLIVNTTQKSVDKSVEQRIVARLTDALNVEDMPSLPKWILNTVERGEVEKAVKYVDYLNSTQDSPWFGKIQMANEDTDTATVNQRSFVKAIVKYVLTANNPLSIVSDFDKEKKIFLNYWKAIHELLDDGNSAVLYKYNGVELFCKFSIPFFVKLQDKADFRVPTMMALLRACFESVEGDYAGVGHPEWWAKGGKASFMNAGAINQISQEMAKALHKTSMSSSIEL